MTPRSADPFLAGEPRRPEPGSIFVSGVFTWMPDESDPSWSRIKAAADVGLRTLCSAHGLDPLDPNLELRLAPLLDQVDSDPLLPIPSRTVVSVCLKEGRLDSGPGLSTLQEVQRAQWDQVASTVCAKPTFALAFLRTNERDLFFAVVRRGPVHVEDNPPTVQPDFAHADDFTWVLFAGTKYEFKKGNQAESVRALWEAWERGGRRNGCGLGEKAIGMKCGSSDNDFRLAHVFRRHTTWRGLIRPVSKGVFALFLPESRENPTS